MVNSRKLKSAMVAAGYNQSQMAKELGIEESEVSVNE